MSLVLDQKQQEQMVVEVEGTELEQMEAAEIGLQIEKLKIDPNASSTEEDEGFAIEADRSSMTKEDDGEIESSATLTFNPPVYLQRYAQVRNVISTLLKDPKQRDALSGNTVLEVGCAEFGMLKFLKGILELGKIMFLDIDEELLMEVCRNGICWGFGESIVIL
jgi:hypothetical protein